MLAISLGKWQDIVTRNSLLTIPTSFAYTKFASVDCLGAFLQRCFLCFSHLELMLEVISFGGWGLFHLHASQLKCFLLLLEMWISCFHSLLDSSQWLLQLGCQVVSHCRELNFLRLFQDRLFLSWERGAIFLWYVISNSSGGKMNYSCALTTRSEAVTGCRCCTSRWKQGISRRWTQVHAKMGRAGLSDWGHLLERGYKPKKIFKLKSCEFLLPGYFSY